MPINMSVNILWRSVWIVLSSIVLTACVSIPEHASDLNHHVSQGMVRNQLQTEKIIHALADSQRALLKLEWDKLYLNAEHKYRRKKDLSTTAILNAQEQRDIAQITSTTYAILLQDISDIEQDLLQKTRENSNLLININQEISTYLRSAEDSKRTAKQLSKTLISGTESFELDLSDLASFTKKIMKKLTKEP